MNYSTPGVYVEEIAKLPPSVAPVNTAIPAFIGYTEKRPDAEPHRLTSMLEYEELFGGAFSDITAIVADYTGTQNGTAPSITITGLAADTKFKMYYSLALYFANGGGPCYVASANTYKTNTGVLNSVDRGELTTALAEIKKEDEPTLLVFPDAVGLNSAVAMGTLYQAAFSQCADLKDRFLISDLLSDNTGAIEDDSLAFRNNIGTSNLKYGGAYYPNLETIYTPFVDYTSTIVVYTDAGGSTTSGMVLRQSEEVIAQAANPTVLRDNSLFHVNNKAYHEILGQINAVKLILPPSSAMAGIYASVDRTRGVWKAPANVSLNAVRRPMIVIDDADQEDLNIDQDGKSINAIRSFTGRGTLVWGARTLAGNDNEWRYVSVRRFFIMAEESIKKATQQFVFENNDANTWVKVKAMINNFLTLQWRAGALYGDKPNEAFFVKVGLGETMSSQDILEGRMIIEIGMAVVRPAEFIILRFSHFIQDA